MPYSVSSSFDFQKDQYAPQLIQRKFTIGSSDYTSRVLKWPTLRTVWNEPQAQSASITLANHDDAMSFLRTTPTTMQTSYAVSVGFNGELISVFQGRATDLSFAGGAVTIRAVDKLAQLGERLIGSTAAPVSYTGSNYLLSDVVWDAITSYGGFSSVKSSSNVDVDYAAFLDWADVFSSNGVYVNGQFEGLTVLEVLRKASRMSQSAIFLREDKLYFKRFTLADSSQVNIGIDNAISQPTVNYTDSRLLNRYHTFADYDVTSQYWKIDAVAANSASVNSYGLREGKEEDDVLWYVNSSSALDLSQRITITYPMPLAQVNVGVGLPAVTLLVGEMFTLTDPAVGASGELYRLLDSSFDLDRLKFTLKGDASQFANGFILDTSSLDGSDLLL